MIITLISYGQVISIDSARTLGVGNTVTISGIVTNGTELGTIRYMQDATAGIAVYDYTFSQNAVRGDSVTVTGTIKDYNQLLEIDPVTNYTVHSSGTTLPSPVVITPGQLNEAVEGELVRINNVTFSGAGGTFSSNTSYTFSEGGQTGETYIRSGHPLIGQVIPSSPVDLIGIGSQYDYSNPNAGYQLIIRDANDIIATSAINLTSKVSISNLSKTGFDLSWTTDTDGTTEIMYGNTPNLELGTLSGTGGPTTSHNISLTGATASEIFYVKAFSVKGTDTAMSSMNTYITQSNSSGDMKAYFTTAVDTSYSSGDYAVMLDDAVDDTLIAYMNRAKYSIDFSIYHFNNTNLSNISAALNAAHNRGVTVRVVFDGDNQGAAIQALDAGIGRIGSPTSSQYGIMHNKFVVIDAESADHDDPVVWTGATNFTDGQINNDPNDVIIIQDKSLALAYQLEFEEMFGSSGSQPNPADSRFGPDKTDNTPHEFIIGGDRVECYFSPSDNTNDKIIETIQSADHNMYIATMLITRSDIGYALEDAIDAGVHTLIKINHSSQSSSSVVSMLQTELDTNFKTNDNAGNIMHHKYMIVDEGTFSDPILLVGSHNWSYSANDRNDENTLIIHNNRMANIYLQEFMTFFPGSATGMEDHELRGVSVYPNPASEQLNIVLSHDASAMLKLYNTNGQLVRTMQLGSQNSILNINNLESGLYILELISGNKVSRQKVMVN